MKLIFGFTFAIITIYACCSANKEYAYNFLLILPMNLLLVFNHKEVKMKAKLFSGIVISFLCVMPFSSHGQKPDTLIKKLDSLHIQARL